MKTKDRFYTNAIEAEKQKVDIDDIVCVKNHLQQDFISNFKEAFMGVPIYIDNELKGNRFYISVSPELYQAIKAKETK
jgi:hypothetical protein